MEQKQKAFLMPEAILKYLLNADDKIDTLIMCKNSEVGLSTTDQNLYEALGSIRSEDDFKVNRLVKFMEVVDVVSTKKELDGKRKILTDEKVKELRKSI